MAKRSKQIAICLDEIESSHEKLNGRISSQAKKILNRWIRCQKDILKKLNYQGEIPRKTRGKK